MKDERTWSLGAIDGRLPPRAEEGDMKRSIALAAFVLIVATGCAGSTDPISGGSTTPAAPAAAATVSCAEFPVEAAHIVSYVHYASLNVGTTNDSTSLMTELSDAVATLQASAPACTPKATTELDALAASVASLKSAYVPGADAAVVTADKAAIESTVASARAAWVAMAMDPAPWDTVLKYGV